MYSYLEHGSLRTCSLKEFGHLTFILDYGLNHILQLLNLNLNIITT